MGLGRRRMGDDMQFTDLEHNIGCISAPAVKSALDHLWDSGLVAGYIVGKIELCYRRLS
jgi:hypothetical protein